VIRSFLLAALPLLALALPSVRAEDKPKESRLFELRVYTANEGKLDAIHKRTKDAGLKLLEKHGMTVLGVWSPVDAKDARFFLLLAHKDKAARDASFKAFAADPDWVKVRDESEKDGKLVAKAEEMFLTATDYSPMLKAGESKDARVFELRTYIATEGHLDNLNARFRDHTVKLFEKHGMTNWVYWNYLEGTKGDGTMLVYFLTHASPDAAKKSFGEFAKDPDWVAARKASEAKAGGSLTAAKDGVKSVFLKPTDYSPTK